jgi:hypothetical protein
MMVVTKTIVVFFSCFIKEHALAQLVEALRYKPEGKRVRFPMVSWT